MTKPMFMSISVWCMSTEAYKQRKEDRRDLWTQLTKSWTAAIIEQTWRHYLHPLVGVPLGDSLADCLCILHGDISNLLKQAIQEQSAIGRGSFPWDGHSSLENHPGDCGLLQS